MNRPSTVLQQAVSVEPERSSGSPMRCPVQLHVARWRQVSFVPLVKHVCANVSARNQSETFNANFS